MCWCCFLDQIRPKPPSLLVSGDVTHEQDAGIHVEVKGTAGKGAVNKAEGERAADIVGYIEGEAEAEQEVRGCQVLHVDHHDVGHLPLSWAEVNLQGEAVEDQTHLEKKQQGMRGWRKQWFYCLVFVVYIINESVFPQKHSYFSIERESQTPLP